MNNNSVEIMNNVPVTVGFSWDRYDKQYSGGFISGYLAEKNTSVDCDASAYILDCKEGSGNISDRVTYDNKSALGGLIEHSGDNKTGGSPKDDEKIMIQLDKIPENIGSFVFTLDIFKEKKKTLSLGKLTRIQVRLYETESDKELGVFSITGIGDKAVQVGELKRINNHWLYQSDPRSLINVKSKEDIKDAIVIG